MVYKYNYSCLSLHSVYIYIKHIEIRVLAMYVAIANPATGVVTHAVMLYVL